ncbi:MAG: hypothetical protein ACR2K1_04630, partial [Saprospiraceae bacterium]
MKKKMYKRSSDSLAASRMEVQNSGHSGAALLLRIFSDGFFGRRFGLMLLAVGTLLLNLSMNALAQSTVHVYSDLAETNYVAGYSTIQAAINNATTLNGYVVRVDAGTYTENVLINKTVELRGANYGMSA